MKRSKGEGSFRQRTRTRKDGTQTRFWEGRVQVGWIETPDGGRKPDVRTVYGRTRQEAAAKLMALRRQAEDGKLPARTAEKLTAGQYLTEWLVNYARNGNKGKGLAENSVRVYSNVIRHYALPAFGSLRLTDIGPHDLLRLYADMARQGRSAKMREIVHRTLREAFQQAVEQGLLGTNPADRVPRSQKPVAEKKRPEALTAEQVRRLLEAAEGRWRLILGIYAACGLRRSELLGLQWQDVDFDHGLLNVRRQALRQNGGMALVDLKTERSRRQVPVPEDLLRDLMIHKLEQGNPGGTALVFPGTHGPLAPEYVWKAFRAAAARAGLPRSVRLHDLRHTCATLLIDAGISLTTVSDLLGHTSIQTTASFYVKTTKTQQEQAREAMQRVLSESKA